MYLVFFGIAYSYNPKHKHNNNKKNNNNFIDILNIDKAKIRLSNGKKLIGGYDAINNDISINLELLCILAISLICIHATSSIINFTKQK